MKREDKGLRGLISAVGLALLAAAVVREARLPAEDRTWHGKIVGVPYDLRRPTWDRVRQTWWAPKDPRWVTPRAFGIGWGLNLGRITALAGSKMHGHG